MLDVHAPHGRVHGFRDFLLHLFTITIGLLIALGLEGCVEWRHHRHLVAEARENLRSEFRDNQKAIADELNSIHREQAQARDDIRTLTTLKNAKGDANNKGMTVAFTFSSDKLQHASWDTSRETGAFAYMPYGEVKTYAEIVDLQSQWDLHQEQLIGQYARAIAYMYRFNDNPSAKDIAASADEGIRIALDIQGELLLCEDIGKALDKEYAGLEKGSS